MMPLEVSKPGDAFGRKPKLSKTGRVIVGAAVALVLVFAAVIIAANHASGVKKEKELAVVNAVERAVVVCENSAAALKLDTKALNAVASYKKQIETEKDALKKADISFEMIGFLLEYSAQDQSVADELNGARNRVFVTLKAYKEAVQ